jgi:hypothetical protein
MASIITCRECGRTFEFGKGGGGTDYCSAGCRRKSEAAKQTTRGSSSSGYSGGGAGSLLTVLKLVGIVFVALMTVITVLCYKFPKFLKEKNKKFLYAYIITWVLLIAGAVVYFSFFSPEAVSGIKVKIVSASCETEDEFVSLVKEALSGISVTVLEGEDIPKQQAYNAVIKREGEYGTFKDAVYFVRLPDGVNVYLWFKTKNQVATFAYKKK